MVTHQRRLHEQLIILQPNSSADWAMNKRILIAVTLLNTTIALAFTSIGAWMILPFAGLETAALLAALYWVNWKLTYRHVLHFDKDMLCIEKGFYHPRQAWRWPRSDTCLLVQQPSRADEPLAICVCRGSETVPVGDFLNREDSQQLLQQLRQQGLVIKGFSSDAQLPA